MRFSLQKGWVRSEFKKLKKKVFLKYYYNSRGHCRLITNDVGKNVALIIFVLHHPLDYAI